MRHLEKTRFYQVKTGVGPKNLSRAHYVTQVFAPYFHEGYCLVI
ncbi:hypothetical protein [uncultured Desulfosarcina sp.]|nr:hypothetical protein [uncultured Desulfosarcina sp.]